jgi:uncharacterized protein YhjY with autotransporter beta-barrel domain
MKKPIFSRQQIFRAIRAVLIAAFLSASHAKADFVYNTNPPAATVSVTSTSGTTNTVTGTGTFSGYFHDAGAGTDNVTIASGSDITSTQSIVQFGSSMNGGAFSNDGTLTQLGTESIDTVGLATSGADLTVANTGTISGIRIGSGPAEVAYALSTTSTGAGSTIINNSGAISAAGNSGATAISAVGTGSGYITINNSGAITASSSSQIGISADTSAGTGAISVINTGSITVTKSGDYDSSVGMTLNGGGNAITVNNGGAVTASGFYVNGIQATTTTGSITILNGANITASGYSVSSDGGTPNCIGINANSAGGDIVVHTFDGGVTATYSSIYGDSAYGIVATTTGAGSIEVTVHNTVTGSAQYGNGYGMGLLASTAAGSITVTDDGTIQGGSDSSNYTAYGANLSTAGGDISVTNLGAIRAIMYGSGNATALLATTSAGGTVSLINDGTVHSESAGGFATGVDFERNGNGTGSSYILNTAGNMITATAAIGAYGVLMSCSSGYSFTVNNGGTITSSAAYGSFGIATQSGGNTTILNALGGVISADATASAEGPGAYGVALESSGSNSTTYVSNSGAITAQAGNNLAAGIVVDADGAVLVNNTSTGVITAAALGVGTNADGIDIASGGDAATVNNSHIITASSVSGTAAGVYILIGDAIVVHNYGSGTITATSSSGGYVAAINVQNQSMAAATTVTNNGILTAATQAGMTTTNSAYGILAGSENGGAITVINNSAGVISADAANVNSSGSAYGISTHADTGATMIVNSGAIHVGQTLSAYEAYGINASGTGAISILNSSSGTVDAVGLVRAYGLSASGYVGTVSIENDGVVNVSGGDGSLAFGLQASNQDGDIYLTNTNAITVVGHLAAGLEASIEDGGNAAIANSGTVTATGSGHYAMVSGLGADTELGSIAVMNRGTVSASGYYASGAFVTSGGAFTLANTGTITATDTFAGGDTSGFAAGIESSAEGNLSVMNSGLITGTFSGYHGSATGISASVSNGTIVIENTGMVTAATPNSGVDANATSFGVFAETAFGRAISITNSGQVNATATSGSAYGIFAFSNDEGTTSAFATVSNTGHVTAVGTQNVDGISVNAQPITVDVANSGVIQAVGPGSTTIGISIQNTSTDDIISNSGAITSSGIGIQDLGTGNITVTNTGGSITSGSGIVPAIAGRGVHPFTSSAYFSIVLGSGNNTVNIIGNSAINGRMDGGSTHLDNTLNFSDITATAAQESNFKTVSAEAAARPTGLYDVMLGPDTYDFTDFNFINFLLGPASTANFGNVDSGLRGLGEQIDALPNGLPGSFTALYLAGARDPEAALNSFSGREFVNAYATIALGDDAAFNELTDNRAFAIRAGGGGLDLSGLSITPSSMIASLGDTETTLGQMSALRFAGTTMSDSKNDISPPPSLDGHRWTAWVAGTVSIQDESTRFDSPGYQATTGSPTVGADYRLTDDIAVGALAHFWTTGANFGDGSRLGVQTGLLGFYGIYSHDNWYADGLVGAGYSGYDSQRATLGGGTADSDPNGNQVLANFSGGYDFKLGAWRISPIAGLQYTHIGIDSYNETGGGAFDLDVADENIDSLRSKIGFHIMRNFDWDGITFTPDLRASWYHEYLNGTRNVSENDPDAAALGDFVIQTVQPDQDFAMAGVGLSATPAMLHDDVTFFTNYNAQVGENYVAHTISGGVRIGF